MMQEDLSKYPPHFRALMAVRPRGVFKKKKVEVVRRHVSALPVSVLRKYHKSQKLPFYTEKLHCAHISRGHDPLLIDLREKWGLDR
jgi:hypothetical protein